MDADKRAAKNTEGRYCFPSFAFSAFSVANSSLELTTKNTRPERDLTTKRTKNTEINCDFFAVSAIFAAKNPSENE
jgi:hypothetical protein